MPTAVNLIFVIFTLCCGSALCIFSAHDKLLKINVSNSDLFYPIDYGLNLIASFQHSSQKLKLQEVVSGKCSKQIDWFYENLVDNITGDGMWALKMIDASAKVPSGILRLNLGGWMGNFDQCLNIKSQNRNIKGNYCLGTLYITIDDPSFLSKMFTSKAKLFAEKKSKFQHIFPIVSYPSFGLCVPEGCDAEDVNNMYKTFNLTYDIKFQCQNIDEANPPFTKLAWCVMAFFLIIIGLMVASTTYDVCCSENNPESISFLFKSFSVYTNGQKLFNKSKSGSDLACLNGIRFLSMMWVIVGHTLSVSITGPVINSLDVIEYLDTTRSMIFANAVHSVDTFLTITGLLVVYSYMKSREMGVSFNLPKFYLHRYLRLTPPFLAVILVSAGLLQYMGSGPHWSFIVNYFQGFCQKNWWSSLIYFQNYINVEQWCLGQTWYLNIDWQLYLLSPIFLTSLTYKPLLGTSLLGLALVIFIIVPFYITWVNELPALMTNLYGDLGNYQNLYYLQTHTRASPWFVGAFVGYFVFTVKKENVIKFNKFVIIGLWCATFTVIPVCIFAGGEDLRSKEYHKYSNAFYNSLVRPTWAVCIGWIVFACTNGYGGIINTFLSLPIFQILNRFTYSIYLLHVTMLYMLIYASKTATYFSFINLAYSFWGITMLSFAVSIFWVLAFESPVLAIEKYFMGTHRTKLTDEEGDKRNA
ncbi:unnamed protein product [Ceutorhynchus assimilis]|uniref:Nose resistant-to-fluoxetine protein N-terminal domain-containing protein n=1 Tax=Ceutorhynchus assimilis TaxID=467358 RepID=A0A9P0DL76_9CUCU|nr:unnamed protein product [Ceutorhynchus assimilis]